MSSRAFLFVALAGIGLAPVGAAAASPDAPMGAPGVLHVTLDQAKVAQLPAGASTLIVGNPAIADVTMLKGNLAMVVTGKGYGATNLIALDAQGNMIDEKMIDVAPTRSVLVVQEGSARVSYWCNPICMPTVQLGDDDTEFSQASGQIGKRNSLAQGGAK